MKTTLIKLNDQHYIVVDDSEIKLNDWVYSMDGVHQWFGLVLTTEPLPKKITHSTEPLEYKYGSQKHGFNMGVMSSDIKLVYDQIKPLDLSEVEEAIYGYSVEKMAQSAFTHPDFGEYKVGSIAYYNGYKDGFKAHQELVKDKLTIDIDVFKTIAYAFFSLYRTNEFDDEELELEFQRILNNIIQSLLPKTEWDIEITPEGKIILL